MNYYQITYGIVDMMNSMHESYKKGNISKDVLKKNLTTLYDITDECFPRLEPDGDVTYTFATIMEEINQ